MIDFKVSKCELEALKSTTPNLDIILDALTQHHEINFSLIELGEDNSKFKCEDPKNPY